MDPNYIFRVGILNGLLGKRTAKYLLLTHRDIFVVLLEICNFSFYFYRYSLLAITKSTVLFKSLELID
jgi:hypothetical protein